MYFIFLESSNTDIKSIKIRGYHLNFDKNSKTFYLNIKKEDTELDIMVNTKDKKANYDIEGNENLEDGSVVKIVVTAQNGDTDTYRIIIQKESTNIIPYIIGVAILIIIIVIIVVVMKNKKKKDNDKDDNKDKKSDGKKKPINKENKNNEDFENEKTIEMPPISEPKEKDNKESYEEEYDDDLDDEMVHIDNDEEEETRILSYAEREELERAKRQKEEEDSSDVSNKIDEEIQKSIKSTSESSGYSTIYKDISVGHNFGHIVWAMGGGTVTACTNVSYSWVEYTEGDSVYRDYAWESYGTTIIYSDSFEQPFDLDNDGYPDIETGTPYTYGATWENQSIPGKSGKIYMRKADESEYE